ncbi:MAG: hypothetical protein IKH81_00360 [Clostridia bacterium]|nr:hypothetical protein [Clostridia bacterium]
MAWFPRFLFFWVQHITPEAGLQGRANREKTKKFFGAIQNLSVLYFSDMLTFPIGPKRWAKRAEKQKKTTYSGLQKEGGRSILTALMKR